MALKAFSTSDRALLGITEIVNLHKSTVCPVIEVTLLIDVQRWLAGSRPSKLMSKALSAAFQCWVQRARPLLVRSRTVTAR